MKLSRRPFPLLLGAAGVASAAAIAIGGTQVAGNASATSSAAGTSISRATNPYAGAAGTPGDGTWGAVPDTGGTGSSGSAGTTPSTADGTTTSGTTGTTTEATASQVVGVVDIVTTVNYDQGEAAGTGMVLTSTGEVLTNNHVVDGATSIEVTVLSTGHTYSAAVVGTSPTNDVSVLQLKGANGLATADFGNSSALRVGDAVTGVGNAGNAAGTSAATGDVTALDQDITASDGSGTNSEDLTGLIMTNAAIEAGDSGGPLYDAKGQVVGIDTAAQTSGRSGQTVAGYAIPIDTALAVAHQITSGVDNATIHQGVPAFPGIQTAQATSNGFAHTASLATYDPGDRVSVAWTDASGTSHRSTVTLASGPAD